MRVVGSEQVEGDRCTPSRPRSIGRRVLGELSQVATDAHPGLREGRPGDVDRLRHVVQRGRHPVRLGSGQARTARPEHGHRIGPIGRPHRRPACRAGPTPGRRTRPARGRTHREGTGRVAAGSPHRRRPAASGPGAAARRAAAPSPPRPLSVGAARPRISASSANRSATSGGSAAKTHQVMSWSPRQRCANSIIAVVVPCPAAPRAGRSTAGRPSRTAACIAASSRSRGAACSSRGGTFQHPAVRDVEHRPRPPPGAPNRDPQQQRRQQHQSAHRATDPARTPAPGPGRPHRGDRWGDDGVRGDPALRGVGVHDRREGQHGGRRKGHQAAGAQGCGQLRRTRP